MIDNAALYSLYGFVGGLTLGLIFRRKMMFAGLCTGFGGGVALNKGAADFNRIESREERITHVLRSDKDRFISKLHQIRLEYFRR